MIGGFLAERFEQGDFMSTNLHETIYVISPEMNSSGQMIFRDNTKNMITGKHIVLLLDTTTTGETIRRCLECIRYYGGIIEDVVAIFSTVKEVDGHRVESLFTEKDVPGYQAFGRDECPYCKKGFAIEAMVNGFGYSQL